MKHRVDITEPERLLLMELLTSTEHMNHLNSNGWQILVNLIMKFGTCDLQKSKRG